MKVEEGKGRERLERESEGERGREREREGERGRERERRRICDNVLLRSACTEIIKEKRGVE